MVLARSPSTLPFDMLCPACKLNAVINRSDYCWSQGPQGSVAVGRKGGVERWGAFGGVRVWHLGELGVQIKWNAYLADVFAGVRGRAGVWREVAQFKAIGDGRWSLVRPKSHAQSPQLNPARTLIAARQQWQRPLSLSSLPSKPMCCHKKSPI